MVGDSVSGSSDVEVVQREEESLRRNASESRVVASGVIGAVVGPSTDTGPSLDVGVRGEF